MDEPKRQSPRQRKSVNQNWERMFALLVEYRTRSPHRWPVDGEFFEGESLGAWCHAQQYNYWKDSLSDSRVSRLNQIHFPWGESPGGEWGRYFELLKMFRQEHQVGQEEWPVQTAVYKGAHLGRWCFKQRTLKSNGRIGKQKEELLNSIGFPWGPITKFDISWASSFEQLKRYRENDPEHWPGINDVFEGTRLGLWCFTQRLRAKQGKLSQVRIKRLKEISFEFTPDHHFRRWLVSYERLKQDLQAQPNHPWKWSNPQLANWYSRQRTEQLSGGLDPRKKALLDQLEIPWQMRKKHPWEESLALLMEFRKAFPNRWPRRREKFRGISLGAWCAKQKRLYKSSKLTAQQVAALTQFGFLEID